ncbi:benzoate/H(+) symporter BenE family transporter [Paenibacillus pini]|uniref:Benzoate transport protein n=1 Tax=Paenibacillus pini JCM 16418 TaxID=1236976 RepID=W7Y8V6_9BACL|nr:benzoate/H(+) symporter BenE family transporter [Paenibacillus pini]GAF07385.1 benzoate transport protein [Paenibacillus pini JCM 16418]
MSTKNIAAGMLSALMACTGGAILIINTAERMGLTQPQLISWLFIVYFVGGSLNIWLSIRYKIPFAGAHSITAAAFLSSAAVHFSLQELAGSFMMAGGLIAILGLSGIFNTLLELIPKPLIDAMLAGLILHYVVQIVPAFKEAPFIGGLAIIGFFLVPKLSKSIPPLMGVLILGGVGLYFGYDFTSISSVPFSWPHLVIPSFTMNGFLSISIPIAVLVLSNDLAVALAALKKNGYEPPVNKTIALSGIGTSIVSLFGGHAVNIGGMMTALCSSEEAGSKETRYRAAIISGILVALFGFFAWKVSIIIQVLPAFFITLITGFSLVSVLLNSLQSSFSESSYRYSILFAFVIAIANVSFLGISSAVWSLLVGVITAKVLGEGSKSADATVSNEKIGKSV